jgi:hypothetical protein
MVTEVPPAIGPEVGVSPVTVGVAEATKVKVPAGEVGLVPPVLVTVTATGPAAWAGDTAVRLVALVNVTLVAAVPPKLTVEALVKLVPVMVTEVPPAVGPEVGVNPVTVGVAALVKVKTSAGVVALVWPASVTVTSTGPTAWAGDTAVRLVALLKVTLTAAVPPKLTVEALVNPVPVIVTEVPPAVGPEVGLSPVTVGAVALV